MGEIIVNGKMIYQAPLLPKPVDGYKYNQNVPSNPYVNYIDDELNIEFIPNGSREYKMKLNKYPQKDFTLNIQVYGFSHCVVQDLHIVKEQRV